MAYTDPVKWMVEHANPQDRSFDDQAHTQLTSFCLEIFARVYALNLPQQLLNNKIP